MNESQKKTAQQARRGFTIIELLIVVIVIGVLAAAGIGKYQGFAENGRAKTCMSNSSTIENAVAMWGSQTTPLSDNAGAEGSAWFYYDGTASAGITVTVYNPVWTNSATGGNVMSIANVIRDAKVFMCPKLLQEYGGLVTSAQISPAQSKLLSNTVIPDATCGGMAYYFYFNSPASGTSAALGTGWSVTSGAQLPGWLDQGGAASASAAVQAARAICWCASYGSYYCDGLRPQLRKYLHDSRWAQY